MRGFLALFRDAWLLGLWLGPSSLAPGTFHASCEMCSGSSWMTCLWLCIWKKHVASFFFFLTVGINCETLQSLLIANLAGFRSESLDACGTAGLGRVLGRQKPGLLCLFPPQLTDQGLCSEMVAWGCRTGYLRDHSEVRVPQLARASCK